MNLSLLSSGGLESEERRLAAARDDAIRARRGKRCAALAKKLSAVRQEIERRKRMGVW